jgi:rare lipoprotein A
MSRSRAPLRPFVWTAVIVAMLMTIECVRPRFPPPYTPRPGTVSVGIASWYGPKFHGKRTANGEIFNQNALTAAHRCWAFGTRVRVTFLETGKSVVVRINDRFPRRDRVIDLSKGAARRIGLIGPGTGKVRLKVLR